MLDGALALRNMHGMRDILRFGPQAGVYVLCADSQGMNECRGLCELTTDGIRLIRTPHAPEVAAVPDGMDPAFAEGLSRALAPMRDRIAGVETAIPFPVRLLDLLGIASLPRTTFSRCGAGRRKARRRGWCWAPTRPGRSPWISPSRDRTPCSAVPPAQARASCCKPWSPRCCWPTGQTS